MKQSLSQNLSTAQSDIAQLQLLATDRQQLSALISTYLNLKFDLELIQEQMEVEKMRIGGILEAAGIDKAKIDGYPLTWVRGGTTSTLDKKKLLAQGVTLAMIDAATVTKPKRDYFQIRDKGDESTDGG